MIERRGSLTSIVTMIALLGLAAPAAAQADPPESSGVTTTPASVPWPARSDEAGAATPGAGRSGDVKEVGAGQDGATEGGAESSETDPTNRRLDHAKRRAELLGAEYQLRLKEKEMELAELELERRALAARAAVDDARRGAYLRLRRRRN